jgi:hypothetical protein
MADRTPASDTPELRAFVNSCDSRNPASGVATGLLLSQEITISGELSNG